MGSPCWQHDYRVWFVTAAELVTLLVEAQQQGRLARELAQLARFDVMIIDELGYVPLDKAGADLLIGFVSQGCRPPSGTRRWPSARRNRVDSAGVVFVEWWSSGGCS